jgi:hypothetical protein
MGEEAFLSTHRLTCDTSETVTSPRPKAGHQAACPSIPTYVMHNQI